MFKLGEKQKLTIVDKKEYNITSTPNASYDPRWGAPFKESNQSAKQTFENHRN